MVVSFFLVWVGADMLLIFDIKLLLLFCCCCLIIWIWFNIYLISKLDNYLFEFCFHCLKYFKDILKIMIHVLFFCMYWKLVSRFDLEVSLSSFIYYCKFYYIYIYFKRLCRIYTKSFIWNHILRFDIYSTSSCVFYLLSIK